MLRRSKTFKARLSSVILSLLALTGCYSKNLDVMRPIVTDELRVEMPLGNQSLVGALKKEFARSNWIVTLSGAPYKIILNYNRRDTCFNLEPYIRYSISMIDLRSKEELVAMSGEGCPSDIAKDFVGAVQKFTRIVTPDSSKPAVKKNTDKDKET
jgi:hypothetical protein